MNGCTRGIYEQFMNLLSILYSYKPIKADIYIRRYHLMSSFGEISDFSFWELFQRFDSFHVFEQLNACRGLWFTVNSIFSWNKLFVKLVHSHPLDWSRAFLAKKGFFKNKKDRPSARNVRRGRQRRLRAPTALPIVEVSNVLSVTVLNRIWKCDM